MPPRGLKDKKKSKDKDAKKAVNFEAEEKPQKKYSTRVPEKIKHDFIDRKIKNFLSVVLGSRVYHAEKARTWSMDLSSRISEMVKEDSPENFKHIALVMIGSVQDKPSIFLGSRCLWNEATDDFMKAPCDFKTTPSMPSLLFTACITNKLKVTEL